MSFSNSSGSCTCGGKQPSGGYDGGRSSHGGGSSHGCGARIFAIKPMCYCGQTAVLRTAKTPKNRGKQFWGCPKFKSGSQDLGGCNFFQWFIEQEIEERDMMQMEEKDVVKMEEKDFGGNKVLKVEKIEEKDVVNMRERDGGWIITRKLDETIVRLQKWMKLMLGMMVVVCVMNVIVISLLL
ncbi:uncharacterized protein LOC114183299 [Vigna unguiculata]|uniref:GRF-type domain-containing protein n=1 Tax=Vigna unguiculata TaxID=3917 RepID=A0A4D6NFG3_VIGUN|nr:uncharacterized protein LOC114183299 [Vigna unguiculata]QCE11671.1 hypothetical protein DEO72_LG10g2907 [Vigna unguiculata]